MNNDCNYVINGKLKVCYTFNLMHNVCFDCVINGKLQVCYTCNLMHIACNSVINCKLQVVTYVIQWA